MNLRSIKTESKILSFIDKFTKDNNFAPSYEEMGKALDMHPTGAAIAIQRLVDAGHVDHEPHLKRNFKITDKGRAFMKAPYKELEQAQEQKKLSLNGQFCSAVFDRDYKKMQSFFRSGFQRNSIPERRSVLEIAFAVALQGKDGLASDMIMAVGRKAEMKEADFEILAKQYNALTFYSKLPRSK